MKFLIIFWCVFFLFQNSVFGFPFFKKDDKKSDDIYPPMVHTMDEWLETSTNVKMDLRKKPENKEEEDERFIPPADKPLYIERYNVKAGSKELDLSNLYKEQMIRSYFISDPNFKNAVYTEVYNYPQTKQTASTIYLIEMDNHLGKKERLKDLSVFEHTRYPLISTALPYLKEDFFSTLTVVDFSPSGNEILVKEKRGSKRYGIYETYVWIYFLTKEDKNSNMCYLNNLAFSNEMDDFQEGNFISKNELSEFNLNQLNFPPQTGLKGTPKDGEIIGAPDMSWLKEGKQPKKPGKLKAIDDITFTYKDIKDFITATWKDELMTSPVKSRWYNKIPVDFRVDIPNSPKEKIGFGVRLNLLNEMIKAYWFDNQNLILNMIRWDLKPLGFNTANENEIIVIAWAYRQDGKEISLGRWGVDIKTGIPRLIPDSEIVSVSANSFYLQEKLNPR